MPGRPIRCSGPSPMAGAVRAARQRGTNRFGSPAAPCSFSRSRPFASLASPSPSCWIGVGRRQWTRPSRRWPLSSRRPRQNDCGRRATGGDTPGSTPRWRPQPRPPLFAEVPKTAALPTQPPHPTPSSLPPPPARTSKLRVLLTLNNGHLGIILLCSAATYAEQRADISMLLSAVGTF